MLLLYNYFNIREIFQQINLYTLLDTSKKYHAAM